MQTTVVTVSDKWQVVIPKTIREKVQVKPRDKVMVSSIGPDKIVVDVIGESLIKKARGALKKYDPCGTLFKEFLKQKREDLKHEDEKWKRLGI